MTVHCVACGHEWILPLALPMAFGRAIAAMQDTVAAGCPACAASGDAIRVGPADPPAPDPAEVIPSHVRTTKGGLVR